MTREKNCRIPAVTRFCIIERPRPRSFMLGVFPPPVSTDNLPSLHKIPETCAAHYRALEAMKLLRPIITTICLPATIIANAGEQRANEAKCVPHPPTNAELQLLQGTWEGNVVHDTGTSKARDFQETGKRKPGEIDLDFLKTKVFETPPRSQGKLTITITGNSLHFHRDANFWWDTTFTLPVATNPKQLHATIKGCPPPAE